MLKVVGLLAIALEMLDRLQLHLHLPFACESAFVVVVVVAAALTIVVCLRGVDSGRGGSGCGSRRRCRVVGVVSHTAVAAAGGHCCWSSRTPPVRHTASAVESLNMFLPPSPSHYWEKTQETSATLISRWSLTRYEPLF